VYDGVIVQCPDCPKAFTTSSDLTVHIRRAHTGEKPYVCDACEYSCASSGNLAQHKRIHTGEKTRKVMHGSCMWRRVICTCIFHGSHLIVFYLVTSQCNACEYTCSIASSLTVHIRTHSGEKPFVVRADMCVFAIRPGSEDSVCVCDCAVSRLSEGIHYKQQSDCAHPACAHWGEAVCM